ncbi:MAG: hypothetical protein IJO91_00330 [Oscillospiraceae bacterium]|nr:hypothetical protein [Oscillospiraceae bacterium]
MEKRKITEQQGCLIYLGINSLILLPWCMGWLLRVEFLMDIYRVIPPFLLLLGAYGMVGVFVQYAILLGVVIYAIYRFVKDRSVPIFVWTLVLCLFNLVLNLYTMNIFYFLARQ